MKNILEIILFFCLAAVVLLFAGCSEKGPSSSESPNGNYTFRLPGGVKLEMVKIKAGTFIMGSPEGELGRDEYREKQRQVTLAKDYWLGTKSPTPNMQW